MSKRVPFHYYLMAHALPFAADNQSEPLPDPVVVATITVDPAFTRHLNPHKHLTELAAKMGLLDFTIESAEAQDRPGHQLGLPFPRPRRKH